MCIYFVKVDTHASAHTQLFHIMIIGIFILCIVHVYQSTINDQTVVLV